MLTQPRLPSPAVPGRKTIIWLLCSLALLAVGGVLGVEWLLAQSPGQDSETDQTNTNSANRVVINWGDPLYTQGESYQSPGPVWWLGAEKVGGEWTNSSWHVPASETNDAGWARAYLDRQLLTNDLMMSVLLFDHPDASLFVDLLDSNAVTVATNLCDNLLTGSNEVISIQVAVPLTNYPTASTIQLRRGTGEITVYRSVLDMNEDQSGLGAGQGTQPVPSQSEQISNGTGLGAYDTGAANTGETGANESAQQKLGQSQNEALTGTTTFYVDSILGNNSFDGLSAVYTNGSGPKRNIYAAIAIADSGSTIQVAAGSYGETSWDAGAKTLALQPVDSVMVYDTADSDNDGIPDWWERTHGLNPSDLSDASWPNLNPWAHGLTNLQVFQNPSVLIADNYNTLSDGIPDWWRVRYFGSGTTTNSISWASGDPDGDNVSNLQEYQAGSNPLDAQSRPSSGWWKLDETNGVTAADASGNGHAGTLHNGPAWVGGVFSNALNFDGTNDWVGVANSATLESSNTTVSCWVWFRTMGQTGGTHDAILGSASGAGSTGDGLFLASTPSGTIRFQAYDASGNAKVFYSGAVTTQLWHMLTLVLDGSNMVGYVDGQQTGSVACVGHKLGTADFTMGSIQGGFGYGNFKLDDVHVYNYSLGGAEIAAMYNADTDGDGLSNVQEVNIYHTDPNRPDTDSDGIPDGSDPNPLDPNIGPPSGTSPVRLYDAYGVFTATSNVYVQANAISTNASITVAAAEYFHTIAGSNGTGVAMSALDGNYNSTNEVVTNTFAPTFPPGERHALWLHAKGSDNQWCPFVKVVLNPTIDDILDKIQRNYSAFRDLQYNVNIIEFNDAVPVETNSAAVKLKGPYKMWSQNDAGFVAICNENRTWWYNDALDIGGAMTKGINGDFAVENNRVSDFFWDVPLSKMRTDASISNATGSATFDCSLTPKSGVLWPAVSFSTDHSRGFVTQMSGHTADVTMKSEYLNPLEVISGHWLFTLHRQTLQFDSGEQIVVESTITNIQVNQGLPDSLFDIPEE